MTNKVRRVGTILLTVLGVSLVVSVVWPIAFDQNAACVGRARMLSTAMQQYIQDYDERLPPMNNVAAFQKAVKLYTPGNFVFSCPETQAAYVPNAALNGFNEAQISSPSSTPFFSDGQAHADGKSTVVFADQHVERGGVDQADPNVQCVNNVRQLSLGVLQYAQDYDEKLPFMQNTSVFQSEIGPYVHNPRAFTCPVTNKAYVPNASLSGRSLASIPGNADSTQVVMDAEPHSDGSVTIGYLSGRSVNPHVKSTFPNGNSNLKSLSLAIQQYTQDYDEKLPPMQNNTVFKQAIGLYVNPPTQFTNPDTGLPYTLNASMSFVASANITDPIHTELLRDSGRDQNGVINIEFADGHVGKDVAFVPQSLAVGPDNVTHVLWKRNDGATALFNLAPNGSFQNALGYASHLGDMPQSIAVGADNQTRILIDRSSGNDTLWTLGANSIQPLKMERGPYDGWSPLSVAVGKDNRPRLLWGRFDGQAAVWYMSQSGEYSDSFTIPAVLGRTPVGLTVGSESYLRLLWSHDDGTISISTMTKTGTPISDLSYIPITGWTAKGFAVGPDNQSWVLWRGNHNDAHLWALSYAGKLWHRFDFNTDPGWNPQSIAVGPDGNVRVLFKRDDGRARVVTLAAGASIQSIYEFPTF